ncbi:hypothetical protein OD90_0419 [Dokdonia sp. Hel_I_53]|nr:hypothetical protein OD90_0419 [Dokdonia sp. Hel_I_53]
MLLVAEIPSFLKTLAIILLIYFVLRFLGRLAWPYIVRYLTKKAGEKMQSAFKGFQQQTTKTQMPPKDVPKKSSEVVGEYIDYEEID